MKTHPLHPQIAMPDHLSQLRIFKDEGKLYLTDEKRIYIGAVYKSEKLAELSQAFNYGAAGYDVLKTGSPMGERIALAQYKNYELQCIKQGHPKKTEEIKVRDLEPDLMKYEENWTSLFNKFAWETGAIAGNNFEVRLTCLQFNQEGFHFDKDIVGVLPCGKGRLGTIFKGPNGEIIRTGENELVINTPQLEHSWPVSDIPRAGLAFLTNLEMN